MSSESWAHLLPYLRSGGIDFISNAAPLSSKSCMINQEMFRRGHVEMLSRYHLPLEHLNNIRETVRSTIFIMMGSINTVIFNPVSIPMAALGYPASPVYISPTLHNHLRGRAKVRDSHCCFVTAGKNCPKQLVVHAGISWKGHPRGFQHLCLCFINH
ncbi:hypothetical protein BD779DRAFT_1567116 [Infundibulicybe gibba]|nr:hypothetical protein BD779DRAFT_1567116 [Infundibulicybe gibba]